MTRNELLRREAQRWLEQAAKDLNAARLLLAGDSPEPSRSVFHSQQAAEKATKALLAFHDVRFRWTHDLAELGVQCAEIEPDLAPVLRAAADLTDYATAFRYPDAPYEPDAEEATQALAIATRLCDEVRRRVVDAPA